MPSVANHSTMDSSTPRTQGSQMWNEFRRRKRHLNPTDIVKRRKTTQQVSPTTTTTTATGQRYRFVPYQPPLSTQRRKTVHHEPRLIDSINLEAAKKAQPAEYLLQRPPQRCPRGAPVVASASRHSSHAAVESFLKSTPVKRDEAKDWRQQLSDNLEREKEYTEMVKLQQLSSDHLMIPSRTVMPRRRSKTSDAAEEQSWRSASQQDERMARRHSDPEAVVMLPVPIAFPKVSDPAMFTEVSSERRRDSERHARFYNRFLSRRDSTKTDVKPFHVESVEPTATPISGPNAFRLHPTMMTQDPLVVGGGWRSTLPPLAPSTGHAPSCSDTWIATLKLKLKPIVDSPSSCGGVEFKMEVVRTRFETEKPRNT